MKFFILFSSCLRCRHGSTSSHSGPHTSADQRAVTRKNNGQMPSLRLEYLRQTPERLAFDSFR